jgi:hypothetical protein
LQPDLSWNRSFCYTVRGFANLTVFPLRGKFKRCFTSRPDVLVLH